MKKSVSFLLFLGLLCICSAVLAGCPAVTETTTTTVGDGTSATTGDETITISGRLGTGLSVSRGGINGKSLAGVVTHIASIPVIAGSPNLGQVQSTPVAIDGSFNIELTPQADVSTLLLLVNNDAATLEEKAVGFASLKSTNGADLVLFPFDMASRSMDFGTLNFADGMAVSSKSLESQQDAFTLEFDKLLETAYHDNMFKHTKNLYVNLHTSTGEEYSELMRFVFFNDIENTDNKWLQLESWEHVNGFRMILNAINPVGYSYSDINQGIADIEVVPPMTFRLKPNYGLSNPGNPNDYPTISPNTPLLASYAVSLHDHGGIDENVGLLPYVLPTDWGTGRNGYTFEFTGFEEIENGKWKFNLIKGGASKEIALFDMPSAAQFTNLGSFIYYMPTIRMVTDSSRRVTRIDMAWFAWNPFMCIYERITDLSTFIRLADNFSFSIIKMRTDAQGNNYNDAENFTDSLQMVPTRDWYLGSTVPEGGTDISWVTALYTIAGVEYSFSLYPADKMP